LLGYLVIFEILDETCMYVVLFALCNPNRSQEIPRNVLTGTEFRTRSSKRSRKRRKARAMKAKRKQRRTLNVVGGGGRERGGGGGPRTAVCITRFLLPFFVIFCFSTNDAQNLWHSNKQKKIKTNLKRNSNTKPI